MVEKHLHQPRWESVRETVANLVCGFIGRVLIILYICPLLGIKASLFGVIEISAVLTVWSFIQHYLIRRHYSKKHATRVLDQVDDHIEEKVEKGVKKKVKRAVNKAVKQALEEERETNGD